MAELKLDIQGMTCGHCVASVRRALEATKGVTVKDVRIGEATVSYDESEVTPTHLVQVVEDEGYSPSVVVT
jgi:copper chaperone